VTTPFEGFEEADRRESGARDRQGVLDDHFDSAVREDYSIVRAIAGASGLKVDDGFEREVSEELAKRMGKAPQGVFVPHTALSRRVRAREMERRVGDRKGGVLAAAY
jgi:hypothetical protein